jgi:methionine-rich copper-binding protein CopC
VPISRVAIALASGLPLLPAPGLAHAILINSAPASGTSVPAGTVNLSLSYNSRIDRSRSRLALIAPDHSQSVLKIVPSGPPQLLQSSAQLTVPGAYVVRWQVLAIDGHITRGDLPFTVTGP